MFCKVRFVSSISFSISGRILSLYCDESASRRASIILGMYSGFDSPTLDNALMHCLAVIGFSSMMWERNSGRMAANRFSSSHCALTASICYTRFLTKDFGWFRRDAKASKYSYHSSVSRLSEMILSAMAQAYLSSLTVNFEIMSCMVVHLQIPIDFAPYLYLQVLNFPSIQKVASMVWK